MQNVEPITKRILAEQLGLDAEQIKLDSKLEDDLGADSLDIVEIVMALEDEFEIEILDEEAEKFSTVGDAIACVKAKYG